MSRSSSFRTDIGLIFGFCLLPRPPSYRPLGILVSPKFGPTLKLPPVNHSSGKSVTSVSGTECHLCVRQVMIFPSLHWATKHDADERNHLPATLRARHYPRIETLPFVSMIQALRVSCPRFSASGTVPLSLRGNFFVRVTFQESLGYWLTTVVFSWARVGPRGDLL